jgi:HAD superfamily hydrolase (TIGR01509 family)
MAMPESPVLLMDVMDTLVYDPFNREIPEFFGLSPAALLAENDTGAWVEFELGWIDEAEYFRRYFRSGRTFDAQAFRAVVRNAYRWVEGAEGLLAELRELNIELHALSNYPPWYQTIEAQLRLSRYLQWTFVSCQTGVRKPAAEAFVGAARALNRTIESLLFVDDRAENCEAARAIGMPAIHFQGIAGLRRDLQRLGYLSP